MRKKKKPKQQDFDDIEKSEQKQEEIKKSEEVKPVPEVVRIT